MYHVEFKEYPAVGKGEKSDRKDLRLVHISEGDAKEMNRSHDNEYGDFKLLYRKATEEDVKTLAPHLARKETPKVDTPAGTIEGKTYDEITAAGLKVLAKKHDINITGVNKPEVWADVYVTLGDE